VVFVIAVFVFGFVAWLAKKMIEAIGLRPADRSMGALFGLVRGAYCCWWLL
jgi:membrane protein required for colicin V production